MALSKDEMDFVIQLLDRRSCRPMPRSVSDTEIHQDIIDKWVDSYFIRDIRSTEIIEPKP